jgi:hypothetical protein
MFYARSVEIKFYTTSVAVICKVSSSLVDGLSLGTKLRSTLFPLHIYPQVYYLHVYITSVPKAGANLYKNLKSLKQLK